ncbi:FAD dependent oxidoreductase [Apiospora arundinis]
MSSSQTPATNTFTPDALLSAMDHEVAACSPGQFPQTDKDAKCYWIDNFPIDLDRRFAGVAPPQDVEADIVIIGSGITGAVVAWRLAQQQPDLRVVVLEARGISSGATGRNGGHICRPEVFDYRELATTFGPEDALRIRGLLLKSRDMMLESVAELGAADKVDLRLDGTIVVFENEEERQKFQGDLAAAREQGYKEECYTLTPEETLNKLPIPAEQARFGSSYLEKSGTVYPRKLVSVLFEAALERMPNLTLHPNTPVSQVSQVAAKAGSSSSPTYVVTTDAGHAVKTKTVFHATNGYANYLMPSLRGKKGVVGCLAHMLGVQPPNNNTQETTVQQQLNHGFGYADFWHWIQQRPKGGPFLYGLATAECMNEYNDCATLPDDHPVRQDMYQFLAKTFCEWFPNGVDVAKHVEYDWTGIQGFTADGASIVGRPNPGSPGEFASVGHNGEGMTRCFACSTVATGMILDYLRGEKEIKAPDWFPRAFFRDEVAWPSQ